MIVSFRCRGSGRTGRHTPTCGGLTKPLGSEPQVSDDELEFGPTHSCESETLATRPVYLGPSPSPGLQPATATKTVSIIGPTNPARARRRVTSTSPRFSGGTPKIVGPLPLPLKTRRVVPPSGRTNEALLRHLRHQPCGPDARDVRPAQPWRSRSDRSPRVRRDPGSSTCPRKTRG